MQNVITGAQRVALRIEKGIDPVLLVVAKKMPSGRHGGRGAERHQGEEPQAHAGYEEQCGPGYQQHHRSAEVGLFQYQRCGYQDHQRGRDQVSETGDVLIGAGMKIARQSQHQGDIHQR